MKLARKLAGQMARDLAASVSADVLEQMYALTGFSAANYYATQAAGGEAGMGTGFGGGLFVRLVSKPATSAQRMLFTRRSAGAVGWGVETNGFRDNIKFAACNGSSAPSSPAHTWNASDIGRLHFVAWLFDGTRLRLFPAGEEIGAPGTLLTGTYQSGAIPMSLGCLNGNGGFPETSGIDVIAACTWTGVPTAQQILDYARAARAAGRLPLTIQGATITHHTPDQAALKALAGLTAPASLEDMVTKAAVDAMTRAGSPTVVAIDLTRDGRRTLGAQGFSTVNHLQAQTAGIRGTAGGLWFATLMRPDAAMASGKHIINCFNAPTANSGYALAEAANAINVSAFNSGGAFVGSVVSIPTTAADTGQPLPVLVNFDGSTWTAYARDGTQVATAAGSFKPNTTTPMRVGLRADNSTEPLDNASVFQLMGGDVALTAGEVAQIFADYKRTGRFVRPAAKADHFYDLTEDFLPTESVTATVQDRVGTDHLTRVGTGLTLAQRTERVYSYEATPIANTMRSLSAANHYSASPGFAGTNAGFRVDALLIVESQAVASAFRMFLSKRAAGNPGWNFYTIGANAMLAFALGGAAVSASAPTYSITAADVGKVLHATGQWDPVAGRVRLHVKRAEIGTGTAFAGPFTPETVDMMIGRRSDGFGADNIALLGWGVGDLATTAEIQAQDDAIMAADDYVPIAGKTVDWWSVKRALVNGALPASMPGQNGVITLSKVGAPAVGNVHARAYSW